MYPTINMKATGIRLRQIMNQKNFTAQDVQQYLELSCVQSVYRWLGRCSMPTIDNLYALSELFQMPIDDINVGNRRYQMPVYNQSFYERYFKIISINICSAEGEGEVGTFAALFQKSCQTICLFCFSGKGANAWTDNGYISKEEKRCI